MSDPAIPAPARPAARKPLLSRVPADFVRAVLKGHSALGLAFAAIIYLVCLTGSIAVFATEFERWEHAAAPAARETSPQSVQRALRLAIARAEGEVEHVYIRLPDDEYPHLSLRLDTSRGNQAWIAGRDGGLIADGGQPWTEFLTRLHINLHLPHIWGVFLVGLTGVALLSSLISGILAHPRIFRDAFHLRIGGSRRLQEADLHNRIGVWALPFHIIVSLTGALLGLTTLIVGVLGFALFQGDVDKVYGLFIPTEPKEDARPADVIDLQPMFGEIARRAPGGRIDMILMEHPTEAGGAAMFNVEYQDGRLANTDTFALHRDGTLYYAKRSADNNLGEDILASLGKLHFGWFGGGIVKIAYALLGLGLSYLAAGGVNIWLARRRDKRRPAPRLERVWAGVVWGQPAALALAALAAVLGGDGATTASLIALWVAATLAAMAAAIWLTAERLSIALRLTTALALILCGMLHMLLRSGPDPVAWAVDLCLIATGAAIGWTVLAIHRRTATMVPA